MKGDTSLLYFFNFHILKYRKEAQYAGFENKVHQSVVGSWFAKNTILPKY